jgi:hypothetical protein
VRNRAWRRYTLEKTFKKRVFERLSNWYMFRTIPYKSHLPRVLDHMGEKYFYILKYTSNYYKTQNASYGKNNNIHSYHLENHNNTRSKHKVEFRKLLIENGLA